MKAIIVEDNPSAANVIRSFVEDSPYGIQVCGLATSVNEAVHIIRLENPSLWFLDIQLHGELVFKLFDKIDASILKNVGIIFITAYNNPDYLYQALLASAIDYIVKPIDQDKLYAAIEKAINKLESEDLPNRIKALEEIVNRLDQKNPVVRVPIYRVNGVIDYMATLKIMYIESSDSICRFFLDDETTVSSTRSLKFYEIYLSDSNGFFRISKKMIINSMHIDTFNSKTNKVILDDANRTALQVSRRKVSELIAFLAKH